MIAKLCAGVSPEQDKWRSRLIATVNRCYKSFRADRVKICSRHFETCCFSMYTDIYAWELSKIGTHHTDLFFVNYVNRKVFVRNIQYGLALWRLLNVLASSKLWRTPNIRYRWLFLLDTLIVLSFNIIVSKMNLCVEKSVPLFLLYYGVIHLFSVSIE